MVEWFDIVKELEFKGGVVFNIQESDLPDFSEVEDHTKLPSFHLTLFSPKEMKPFKEVHGLSNKEAKLKVRELLEDFDNVVPSLNFGARPHIAFRGEQQTTFFRVMNNADWQNYLDDLATHLSLPLYKRYFHVSVANNQGGNPYKSIGDINTIDERGYHAWGEGDAWDS